MHECNADMLHVRCCAHDAKSFSVCTAAWHTARHLRHMTALLHLLHAWDGSGLLRTTDSQLDSIEECCFATFILLS
jgi:hypothetical protein